MGVEDCWLRPGLRAHNSLAVFSLRFKGNYFDCAISGSDAQLEARWVVPASGALLGCTSLEEPSAVSRVRGTHPALACFEDPPLALQLLGTGGLHFGSRSTVVPHVIHGCLVWCYLFLFGSVWFHHALGSLVFWPDQLCQRFSDNPGEITSSIYAPLPVL